MLEFSDKPYDPVAPNPNRLVISLARQVNRNLTLKGDTHRIKQLEVLNPEMVGDIKSSGNKHVLFVANHSTHSDPQALVETQRQLGMSTQFMAAYDVFLRSSFDSWVMQRTGTFSVDRDSGDLQAMKTAVETLVDGKYGLSIFPEGNVYFMNDRVQPFMEGAAYIAMKAQKTLGIDTTVWVVPVSIKATHLHDQRAAVKESYEGLAAQAGTELATAGPWCDTVKHLGMKLLKHRLESLGFPSEHLDAGNVAQSLEKSAVLVIENLERDLDQKPKPKDTLADRIRKLRRSIHQIRIDPKKLAATPQAEQWADNAMFVLRILSYSGGYLEDKPTLDRFAETADKLNEDFMSQLNPPIGDRKIFTRLSEPIALSAYLDDYKTSMRSTLDELTRTFENRIQYGLDAINLMNPCKGGKAF
jgi:1-acyl-sn-glycerol-3-phosphate acyltransferase